MPLTSILPSIDSKMTVPVVFTNASSSSAMFMVYPEAEPTPMLVVAVHCSMNEIAPLPASKSAPMMTSAPYKVMEPPVISAFVAVVIEKVPASQSRLAISVISRPVFVKSSETVIDPFVRAKNAPALDVKVVPIVISPNASKIAVASRRFFLISGMLDQI